MSYVESRVKITLKFNSLQEDTCVFDKFNMKGQEIMIWANFVVTRHEKR